MADRPQIIQINAREGARAAPSRSGQLTEAALRQSGGVYNSMSGLGGPADKAETTLFYPSLYTQDMLETVYVESWAAKKYIDIPIDDMFVRGREWEAESDSDIEKIEEKEDKHDLINKLANGMKAGRLFGTAFVVFMIDDGKDDTEELDYDSITEESLKSVFVVTRYETSVLEYYINPYHHKFGQPAIYQFTPNSISTGGHHLEMHESRTLRFDGIRSLVSSGWLGTYEPDWGVSNLVDAMNDILHDATFAAAVSHLAHEASIPVVKVEALKEALSGTPSPDEPTIEEIGESMNSSKSIYNTVFLDKNDEFERVNVTFSGLSELLNSLALRLAGMADIPATRFLGRSPVGLNATGDSDMLNYVIHVAAMQKKMLRVPMLMADRIIAADCGLADTLDYKWLPLTDLSQKEQNEISKMRTETIIIPFSAGTVDENEVRERLSEDELWDDLEEWDETKLAEMRPPEPVIEGGEGGEGGGGNGEE